MVSRARHRSAVGPAVAASLRAMILVAISLLGTSRALASEIEEDWILQAQVRDAAAGRGGPTTAEDAAGGCDGVKDGRWGFHTENEPDPWWQVDLGEERDLARVVIFNRCEGGLSSRAARLRLLVSGDGREWREAYRHDGTDFLGFADGKPLVVALDGVRARFVRIQLPGTTYFHLDEVEVYGKPGAPADPPRNLALGRPADQSSTSQWSARKRAAADLRWPVEEIIDRGRKLAADLRNAGVATAAVEQALDRIEGRLRAADADRQALYLQARREVRALALSNPLLDFERILFVKRAPGVYSHMSDQFYGWWSRPGGGLFVLEGIRGGTPVVRPLVTVLPEGSTHSADLSWDGSRIVFTWCRHHPGLAGEQRKSDKANIPEDAFYHIFEVSADGTGLRQLTHGKYDDFDPRWLPDGDIAFLSTRRGQFPQCTRANAERTRSGALPDSYVRCGGGDSRPVAVFTLHVMDRDGGNLRPISAFENFEWTPSVANDGTLLFARWDYVDRHNQPFMSLWSTHPDGTNLKLVYGNFTVNPLSVFEARPVPGSSKMVFTASAHHSISAGSIVLLDPAKGLEGLEPLTRLTPEVCFPESEGWPKTYYSSPLPLSETYHLVAWSPVPLLPEGQTNPANAQGIYLLDAFGNLELLHRDPAISSLYPLPLRPRPRPPVIASKTRWDEARPGELLVLDVGRGLGAVGKDVKGLRVIGVPPKTQPQMNSPSLGVTNEDPGKFVLGTVPVEADGSAYFRIPAGVPVFFQALDADGKSIQTMRSLTYVQAGLSASCIGCHESRETAPPNRFPLAARRPPSKLRPGPDGSWPLRFDRLVQPLLDRKCTSCHAPGSGDEAAEKLDLTARKSYDALLAFGGLRDHVVGKYREGRSVAATTGARESRLLALLGDGKHHDVRLDGEDLARLVTWIDVYAQRLGHFSDEQERSILELRESLAAILER